MKSTAQSNTNLGQGKATNEATSKSTSRATSKDPTKATSKSKASSSPQTAATPSGRGDRNGAGQDGRANRPFPIAPQGTAIGSSGFGPAVRDFMAYLRVERGLSSATLSAYGRDLDDLVGDLRSCGVPDVLSVTPDHIDGHLKYLTEKRGLDPSSRAQHVAAVRSFFNFLHTTRRIETNPTRFVDMPKHSLPARRVLAPSQMRKLVEAPTPDHGELWIRDRAILEFMYASGVRASEVGSVRLNQWCQVTLTVTVIGKGNKQRLVPVGVPAAQAMVHWIETQRAQIVQGNEGRADYRLFVSNRGKPLERVAVWGIVTKYAAIAGLHDVHPHILRHSFATDLLQGGCDLRTVQEFLGHASVVTTQIYTHLDKTHLRSVVRKFHPRFDR